MKEETKKFIRASVSTVVAIVSGFTATYVNSIPTEWYTEPTILTCVVFIIGSILAFLWQFDNCNER